MAHHLLTTMTNQTDQTDQTERVLTDEEIVGAVEAAFPGASGEWTGMDIERARVIEHAVLAKLGAEKAVSEPYGPVVRVPPGWAIIKTINGVSLTAPDGTKWSYGRGIPSDGGAAHQIREFLLSVAAAATPGGPAAPAFVYSGQAWSEIGMVLENYAFGTAFYAAVPPAEQPHGKDAA